MDCRLLLVLVATALCTEPVSAAATCITALAEARKAYPNAHLYRSGGCWGPRKVAVVKKKPPPPRPMFEVIQPWTPVERAVFTPWDERIAPP